MLRGHLLVVETLELSVQLLMFVSPLERHFQVDISEENVSDLFRF